MGVKHSADTSFRALYNYNGSKMWLTAHVWSGCFTFFFSLTCWAGNKNTIYTLSSENTFPWYVQSKRQNVLLTQNTIVSYCILTNILTDKDCQRLLNITSSAVLTA